MTDEQGNKTNKQKHKVGIHNVREEAKAKSGDTQGNKTKKQQAQLRLCKLGLGTVLIFYKSFAPTSVYMKRFALVVFA